MSQWVIGRAWQWFRGSRTPRGIVHAAAMGPAESAITPASVLASLSNDVARANPERAPSTAARPSLFLGARSEPPVPPLGLCGGQQACVVSGCGQWLASLVDGFIGAGPVRRWDCGLVSTA